MTTHHIHICPYYGHEHKCLLRHPYLLAPDKRIILVHPEVRFERFISKTNVGARHVIRPLHNYHFQDAGYESQQAEEEQIGAMLYFNPLHDIEKNFSAAIIYVPKRRIAAIGSFLFDRHARLRYEIKQSSTESCKQMSDFVAIRGGEEYIFFEFWYTLTINESETHEICCRLYTTENSFHWPISDEEIRVSEKLVIEENGFDPLVRPYQEKYDGPIRIR